jgi:uncharacterized protein (TIGR00297 family)
LSNDFLIGLVLGLGLSFLAHRAGALTGSGVVAASVLGTIVFGAGGWSWALVLLAFFATSSALSRLFEARKRGYEREQAKGSRRDAGQVMANGAAATVFAAAHLWLPEATWPWFGFAGALAAANADTWATELGLLSRGKPCLITHPSKKVDPGTSGAVSGLGILAAILGASLVATVSSALVPANHFTALMAVLLGGIAGSVFDSFLGATAQAIYHCPAENRETERHPLHTCGTPTTLIRGWKWLTNDAVNACCTGLGGATAVLLASLLRGS